MAKITIYHTNDMHNCSEPVQAIKEIERDGSCLLLDAGDALKGSNTVFKISEEIIDLMNSVGYDAMAMGNREFNYLRWVLKQRYSQAQFPILCANLKDVKGVAGDYYRPHIIKEVNGIKVGIIGMTPVQYTDDSFWFPIMKFRFLDPVKTAINLSAELKKKTDLVILLSHLGKDKDIEVAKEAGDIDLILGGHTHDLLERPLDINGTPIFQAGCFGKYYGKIDLDINSGIKDLKYELVKVR